jgi:hypothetical protein
VAKKRHKYGKLALEASVKNRRENLPPLPPCGGGVAFCNNPCFSREKRMFLVFLCFFPGKFACFSLSAFRACFLGFFALHARFALVF